MMLAKLHLNIFSTQSEFIIKWRDSL